MKSRFSWLSPKDLRHVLCLYLAIALVILVILLPIYTYADDLFVHSELIRYQSALDQGAEELTSTIAGINNAIYSTRQGSSFLTLRYDAQDQLNPVTLKEQQSIFKGYFIQQDAVFEAGLIFSRELVLTTAWIFYPGVSTAFYPHMFRCGEMSFEAWLDCLQANGAGFLPEMGYYTEARWGFDALTYAAPWGTNATLYVLILSDHIRDMFVPAEVLSQCGFCLTRQDDTVLYAWGDEAAANAYTLSAAIPGGGLTASLYIPQSVLNQSLRALRQTVVCYLGAVLLIAITLTVLFACFATAKPLSSLSARLPEAAKGKMHPSSLRSSYRRLAEGITSMDQTILSQRAAIAQQSFEMALVRGFLSQEETRQFEALFPDFPARYRLVLYRLGAGATPALRERAMAACREVFGPMLPHPVDHDGLLAVMDAACWHREEAAYLRESLQEKLEIAVTASASEIHQGPEGLHNAWMQLTNIECCAPWGSPDHLRTTRDLPEKRITMPLSLQDLQTLYGALNTANLPLALSVLENCAQLLEEKEDNSLLYHHTYLMIQRMLRQMQLENPVTLSELAIPAYVRQQRAELFSSALPACFSAFCQALGATRAATSKNSAPLILDYLNARLASPDLCVDSAASHFGISSTTLQRLCKEATGLTVAAYIETQRLAKACQLLTQTSAPIAQVASDCGFNSPNSFYKAFKRRYGKAPRSISDLNGS